MTSVPAFEDPDFDPNAFNQPTKPRRSSAAQHRKHSKSPSREEEKLVEPERKTTRSRKSSEADMARPAPYVSTGAELRDDVLERRRAASASPASPRRRTQSIGGNGQQSPRPESPRNAPSLDALDEDSFVQDAVPVYRDPQINTRPGRANTIASPRARPQELAPPTPAAAAANNLKEQTVDAWEKMQEGAVMLKFGKRGDPHFRVVGLTEDRSAIVYFSKGKDREETRLDLRMITRVTEGIRGKSFASAIGLAGEFRECAFSIWYNYDRDSLDLIAINSNDYHVWVAGLHCLVDESRRHPELFLRRINYNNDGDEALPESHTNIKGCQVQLKPIVKRTKYIPESKRKLRDRAVLVDEVNKICRKIEDICATCEDMRNLHAFTRTETWQYAQPIIENLKKVNGMNLDAGNLADLDFEVWWMTQQLDALLNLAYSVGVEV
jgi:hypothetical protein